MTETLHPADVRGLQFVDVDDELTEAEGTSASTTAKTEPADDAHPIDPAAARRRLNLLAQTAVPMTVFAQDPLVSENGEPVLATVQVPAVVLAVCTVRPAGTVSVITTASASEGPVLVAVRV